MLPPFTCHYKYITTMSPLIFHSMAEAVGLPGVGGTCSMLSFPIQTITACPHCSRRHPASQYLLKGARAPAPLFRCSPLSQLAQCLASVAVAAEQVGHSQRALEAAREAYGVSLGSSLPYTHV